MANCKTCKYRNCENCDLTNEKAKSKRKLENYIYMNLQKYGNCVIGKEVINKIGIVKVKKDLEANGFTNVDIYASVTGVYICTASFCYKD